MKSELTPYFPLRYKLRVEGGRSARIEKCTATLCDRRRYFIAAYCHAVRGAAQRGRVRNLYIPTYLPTYPFYIEATHGDRAVHVAEYD